MKNLADAGDGGLLRMPVVTWPVPESVSMTSGKERPGQLIRHVRPCRDLEYVMGPGDPQAVNKSTVDKE